MTTLRFPVLLAAFFLLPSGCSGDIEGDEPGECSDGGDNDNDGNFDCDDSDCQGAPVCQGTTTTTTTTTSATTSTTTTNTAEPLDDLIGNTYGLDLSAGRFVEPPGIGGLIGGLLEAEILLGITNATTHELHFLGGLSNGGNVQDMCVETFEVPAADFTGHPDFIARGPSLPIDVEGIAIEFEDYSISGTFAAGDSEINNVTFAGTMDLVVLEDLVGGDACDLMATFGVSCQPCANGTVSCLDFVVDSMDAPLKSGLTLAAVSASDVANNPSCN